MVMEATRLKSSLIVYRDSMAASVEKRDDCDN